jgi:retinol dehydrogenase-12
MMSAEGVEFDPARDIPNLAGKTILITGANTGLGRQTALELAKHHPAELWLTARDEAKGQEVVAAVQKVLSGHGTVNVLPLDLTSFASVQQAAETFLFKTPRLDILYLNAGILGAPAGLTKDGYEIHIGVNHLGHALLLHLLIQRLLETASSQGAPPRVVSVASIGYKYCGDNGIALSTLRDLNAGLTPMQRYTQSKLANVLYAQEVARHFPQFTTLSIDPGSVATELFSREPGDAQVKHLQENVAPKSTKPVQEGVKNHLWAGTIGAEKLVNGRYYEPVGKSGTETGAAKSEEKAKELWEWTQEVIRLVVKA